MVLSIATLVACGPKTGSPTPSSVSYELHVVLEPPGDQGLLLVPEPFTEHVTDGMRSRGYQVSVGAPALQPGTDSESRTQAVSDASNADVIALVELSPRFSSLMAGRYRWDVEVTATLATNSGVQARDTFHLPAVLRYEHDDEADAVTEAAPDVARKLVAMANACGGCR